MRSDNKLPSIGTIINDREYIGGLNSIYKSGHKRNFIDVRCVKCGLISHIEIKDFRKYGCKCNQLNSIKSKHGFACKGKSIENRFYNIFCGIHTRCKGTSDKTWKHLYYGKGIKCERNSFDEFKNDMRDSYQQHIKQYGIKNTSIDRIDGNGNYSKSNCRRATCEEQSNNTKLTIKVEIDGKIYGSQDISNITGISKCAARERLKKFKKGIIDKDKLFFKI